MSAGVACPGNFRFRDAHYGVLGEDLVYSGNLSLYFGLHVQSVGRLRQWVGVSLWRRKARVLMPQFVGQESRCTVRFLRQTGCPTVGRFLSHRRPSPTAVGRRHFDIIIIANSTKLTAALEVSQPTWMCVQRWRVCLTNQVTRRHQRHQRPVWADAPRRVKRDLAVYGKLSPRRVPVSAQIKIRIRFTILLSPEILPSLWSEKDSDSSMISRPLLHRPFIFKPELPHTLAVSLFENRKSYRERGFGSPYRGVPSTHPRSRIYISLMCGLPSFERSQRFVLCRTMRMNQTSIDSSTKYLETCEALRHNHIVRSTTLSRQYGYRHEEAAASSRQLQGCQPRGVSRCQRSCQFLHPRSDTLRRPCFLLNRNSAYFRLVR